MGKQRLHKPMSSNILNRLKFGSSISWTNQFAKCKKHGTTKGDHKHAFKMGRSFINPAYVAMHNKTVNWGLKYVRIFTVNLTANFGSNISDSNWRPKDTTHF